LAPSWAILRRPSRDSGADRMTSCLANPRHSSVAALVGWRAGRAGARPSRRGTWCTVRRTGRRCACGRPFGDSGDGPLGGHCDAVPASSRRDLASCLGCYPVPKARRATVAEALARGERRSQCRSHGGQQSRKFWPAWSRAASAEGTAGNSPGIHSWDSGGRTNISSMKSRRDGGGWARLVFRRPCGTRGRCGAWRTNPGLRLWLRPGLFSVVPHGTRGPGSPSKTVRAPARRARLCFRFPIGL